jgi:CheY-like chemotaxis protein
MVLNHQDDIEVVAQAGNGLEAIEAAHTHRPDVILMDIRMPDMDGLEATSRIIEEADSCFDGITGYLAMRSCWLPTAIHPLAFAHETKKPPTPNSRTESTAL